MRTTLLAVTSLALALAALGFDGANTRRGPMDDEVAVAAALAPSLSRRVHDAVRQRRGPRGR